MCCQKRAVTHFYDIIVVYCRSSLTQTHSNNKRRPAGDGMDTEIEDPELIFELPDHNNMGDCQCACENVVYGPGYTTCLQVRARESVRENVSLSIDLQRTRFCKQQSRCFSSFCVYNASICSISY